MANETAQEKLLKTIQNNIGDSMPEFVGEELRKVLNQATLDSAKVAELMKSEKTLREQLLSANNNIHDLKSKISSQDELKAREEKLKEDTNNLKIKELEYQLAAEKEKTNFSKEVALGLVRNTVYRNNLMGNKTEVYSDQYGSRMQQNLPNSSMETTQAE